MIIAKVCRVKLHSRSRFQRQLSNLYFNDLLRRRNYWEKPLIRAPSCGLNCQVCFSHQPSKMIPTVERKFGQPCRTEDSIRGWSFSQVLRQNSQQNVQGHCCQSSHWRLQSLSRLERVIAGLKVTPNRRSTPLQHAMKKGPKRHALFAKLSILSLKSFCDLAVNLQVLGDTAPKIP